MSELDWGVLLPGQVADWINFDRSNQEWHYGNGQSISMASKQAEGVAYLWNLLSSHNVALLADEVGMGKTFQALGVAALLWKMKPDARVLVMAPNRDICAHWEREYSAFVRFHYREVDHCVKNSADQGPVQSIRSCWRLEDLAQSIESGAGHLYLTTIHSLSGLVPQSEKGGDICKIATINAGKIHSRIKSVLGGKGFDLIIIDEAHYFRNVDGGSQRASAARSFFGNLENSLGHRTLLLTATPSHTKECDVENILSYFLNIAKEEDCLVSALMRKYGLRRLRLMQGKGTTHYSKYQYRHEKDIPADFSQRPESEMFFALYQKKLVTEVENSRDNKRILYGFLEGFESIGKNGIAKEQGDQTENNSYDDERGDYYKAPDTELLRRLTGQYYNKFNKFPDHPKYGNLVEQCKPKDLFTAPRELHEDKHLVFVRRIPSVRELVQRLNEAYDEILAARIYEAWGLPGNDQAVKRWRDQSWSRTGFERMIRKLHPSQDGDEFDSVDLPDHEPEPDSYLGSAVADLFVVKKGKNGRTDCSNVSLRFRKSESAFALFLEPSSDYKVDGYDSFYEYSQGDKIRPDYINAAKDQRLVAHNLHVQKMESVSRSGLTKRNYKQKMKSVWSLVYPLLEPDQQKKMADWAENHPDVAENFSNYIKTGFLFASPVMVELYSWFIEFNRGSSLIDVQDKYLKFMEFVAPKMLCSLLLCYFKSALDTFEILCEKIIDHKPGEWEKDWRMLTSLQNPAWYASGQSGNRQRLILGFNSPFYPNVLVATSVFQEGVNLHLQCRKVHHYGIAWSPGDNEQRVGRIDRLFGKVNELLKIDGLAEGLDELEINYPFLKNSFDEDQVASFITKKFLVEEKMDACIQPAFDHSIELTQVDWKEYLRKPIKSIVAKDPYEARFDTTLLPSSIYVPFNNHHDSDIATHISFLFRKIINPAQDVFFAIVQNQHSPNAMFFIDPVVENEALRRRQPVLVEKHFSVDFSSLVNETVYYVSLKSPIASKETLGSIDSGFSQKFEGLYKELDAQYPLVKIAVNPDASTSHFYLHTRVDLPVFVKLNHLSMLSINELRMAFHQLKQCSDHLEYELFDGKQDIAKEDLNMNGFPSGGMPVDTEIKGVHSSSFRGSRWEQIKCSGGDVERIKVIIHKPFFDKKYLAGFVQNDSESSLWRALILNDRTPFVRFWPAAGGVSVSIDYPAGDFQSEERQLLERWFDFIGGCDWINRDM